MRVSQRISAVHSAMFGSNASVEVELVGQTAREIATAGPFPDVPVAVFTGGKSPPTFLMSAAAREIRLANQRDLLTLSRHTRQLVAEKSGHFPQITEPAVVAQAILSIVGSAPPAVGRR